MSVCIYIYMYINIRVYIYFYFCTYGPRLTKSLFYKFKGHLGRAEAGKEKASMVKGEEADEHERSGDGSHGDTRPRVTWADRPAVHAVGNCLPGEAVPRDCLRKEEYKRKGENVSNATRDSVFRWSEPEVFVCF